MPGYHSLGPSFPTCSAYNTICNLLRTGASVLTLMQIAGRTGRLQKGIYGSQPPNNIRLATYLPVDLGLLAFLAGRLTL